ncbi:cerebellin-1-like [Ylistrum balloti]|uniref:cerebellin-1-like n=1 Tax=Ylistrum balloti TaxID=509963 RepID=UPI002905F493|nr:cerebellin-1-like [Ylistrum balloti]
MHWPLFPVVLLIGIWHGGAEERGTERDEMYIGSSARWDDDRRSEELLRRLVPSLIERMDRQETRLQQLEEGLKLKDVQIDRLERELHDLKTASTPNRVLVNKQQINATDRNAIQDLLGDNPGIPNISQQVHDGNPVNEISKKSVRVSSVDASWTHAFSVSLSNTLVSSPGSMIIFDEVHLDVGNNYNKGDGVYQVPVSGLYVFNWIIVGIKTEWLVTELVINGSSRGSLMTCAEYGHAYDSSTGVIVTPVNAGDHVLIRSTRGGTVRSVPDLGKSMFSGWRIS